MRILAIICARNEFPYLVNLLPYLASENIDVAIIDNESTDGTIEKISNKTFSNVVQFIRIPYNDCFDLTRQLEAKTSIGRQANADWLIHQDADEILAAPTGWGGLRQQIEEAHASGCNVVNFNEMVMLPKNPSIDDILNNNTQYYFFEPRPLRLMRAWKRSPTIDNLRSGGHILQGEELKVWPQRMLLKHFIVRTQQHAFEKYLNRSFSPDDLAKGWHGNRQSFTEENLMIPTASHHLHELPTPKAAPDRLPMPVPLHFWQWGN